MSDDSISWQSVPYGNGCLRCRGACDQAMGYMDFDEICKCCLESETFKNSLQNIIAIASIRQDGATSSFGCQAAVSTGTAALEDFKVKYDAFTLEEFQDQHAGFSPDALQVDGIVRPHPISKEPTTVYPVANKLCSFELSVSSQASAVLSVDRMPVRVYEGQPSDTHNYFCQKQGRQLLQQSFAPPSQRVVKARLAAAQRLRHLGSRPGANAMSQTSPNTDLVTPVATPTACKTAPAQPPASIMPLFSGNIGAAKLPQQVVPKAQQVMRLDTRALNALVVKKEVGAVRVQAALRPQPPRAAASVPSASRQPDPASGASRPKAYNSTGARAVSLASLAVKRQAPDVSEDNAKRPREESDSASIASSPRDSPRLRRMSGHLPSTGSRDGGLITEEYRNLI